LYPGPCDGSGEGNVKSGVKSEPDPGVLRRLPDSRIALPARKSQALLPYLAVPARPAHPGTSWRAAGPAPARAGGARRAGPSTGWAEELTARLG